ncbi:MAG: hypothetical protein RR087_03945, partial [Oscillospiraceae bacterium]
MKNGTYHKKLSRTFILIGVCFVLCFGFLMSWLMISVQKANYRFALQHTMAAKSDTVKVSLSTVLNALYTVQKDPIAHQWANSKTDAEYYFYATRLFQNLGKAITNISLISYDVFVTKPDDTSFVIGLAETQSKESFFTKKNSGISHEEYKTIVQHFDNNNEPYTLPIYENNVLKALYQVVNYTYGDAQLLYFMRIPVSVIVGAEPNQKYIIFDNHATIAYSSIAKKDINQLQHSYEFLATQKYSSFNTYEHFTYKGKDFFSISAAPFPWTIAFLYDNTVIFAPTTILSIFIPLILFSLCCFFAFKII